MSSADNRNPRSAASIASVAFHVMLVPIPIVCFVGTLVTDIVYWQTADMFWSDMSAWLLVVGLVIAFFAVIVGLVDFFGDRGIRVLRAAWLHVVANALVLILEIVNALVHTRDAYTSVVPTGLALSALSVLILLVTAWSGRVLVFRHGVGVHVPEETDR